MSGILSPFQYQYTDNNGINQVSFINAKGQDDALQKIKELGIEPYDLKTLKINKSFFSFEPPLRPIDMINIFSTIKTMDKAGLDIVKSLEMLKNEIASNRSIKNVCTKIYDNVKSGSSLSDAMKASSKSFTQDITSIIAIAEKTGSYGIVLDELIKYIEWFETIKRQAKRAVTGPVMSIILMFAIVMLMANYAVPKMVVFLSSFGAKLPASTVFLIKLSDFIRNNLYLVIGTILFTPVLIILLGKSLSSFKTTTDYIKLKIPVFGKVVVNLDVARFISFFILMYNSGADVLYIMNKIKDALSNKYLSKRIGVVCKRLEMGESLFTALDREKAFPVMFRKMFAVGEVTNDFSGVLQSIKLHYESETQKSIDLMIGAIKPIMMLIMAGLITWMGNAMLGPVYSNIANIAN